jgi:hypothetical protein
MARKSKLSRLLTTGNFAWRTRQFQLAHAQQIARIVDILGGALLRHLVVLAQEGGQTQRLQMMFEKYLRCIGGDLYCLTHAVAS